MGRQGKEETIGPREAEVLRSIIQAHIRSGEPVGSARIAQEPGLDVSPATIRGIMSELEERGLLAQPHTSAGRTPTHAAYRVYVDQLLRKRTVTSADRKKIQDALRQREGELGELLGEASRQLSQFSHQVGLVLAPDFKRVVVDHLEFVRLDSSRVIAVLVGRSRVVEHRVVRTDEDLSQIELDRIGAYLSEQFAGQTLPRMRRELLRRLSEEVAAYDRLVARSFELARRTVEAGAPEGSVFVDGASNLVGSPEFSDVERMRSLLRTLEEKNRLVELLSRLLESEGLQVVIGEENPVESLQECSLVASTYGSGTRVMGTVGIVGPMRMEYGRAIALVDFLAGALTRLLDSPKVRG